MADNADDANMIVQQGLIQQLAVGMAHNYYGCGLQHSIGFDGLSCKNTPPYH